MLEKKFKTKRLLSSEYAADMSINIVLVTIAFLSKRIIYLFNTGMDCCIYSFQINLNGSRAIGIVM